MTIIIEKTRAILCISTILLLSGCAETPIFKGIPILGGVEKFLAESVAPNKAIDTDVDGKTEETVNLPTRVGDIVAIYNQDAEKIYDVKVEKIFHAASNRLCIYFHEPNIPKSKEPSGLACLNDDSHWIKIPLRIIKNLSD